MRSWSPAPGVLRLRNDGDLMPVAPYELVERIRASINVLGPLLTRCGRVRLSMPGGDDFGARPIDMHVAGLEAMGATFKFSHGELEATADRLHGADVTFAVPERRGDREHRHRRRVRRRRDDDRQRRPRAGGRRPLPDARGDGRRHRRASARRRSSCAASSAARCGRPTTARCPTASRPRRTSPRWPSPAASSTIRDARAEHMQNLLARFADMGLELTAVGPARCRWPPTGRLRSIDVQTLPYPGIATDYKPLVITMLSVADDVGIVTENLYPGRFRYVEELIRLGADIRTNGHHAVVRGVPRLSGRAGAGPRHPGRGGDGRRRPGRRGRDRDHAASATSTAATTTSSAASPPSAPTSGGSEPSECFVHPSVRAGLPRRTLGCDQPGRSSASSGPVGPGHPAAGQPQEAGDDGDRAGDQEDLVPPALVGEERRRNAGGGEGVDHTCIVRTPAWLNGVARARPTSQDGAPDRCVSRSRRRSR